MNKFNFKIKENSHSSNSSSGYAMLYTVVIVSIIMTISIGLSNSVSKELILASVAKDSQTAFYQADIATECGLYLELKQGGAKAFLSGGGATSTFSCGVNSSGQPITFSFNALSNGVFEGVPTNVSSGPCFNLLLDSTKPSPDLLIEAKGYNQCDPGAANRVERALDVYY
jgi:hypothetical protein